MDKKRLVRHFAGYLPFDHVQAVPQVTMSVHLLLIPSGTLVEIVAKLFSRLPFAYDSICSGCFFSTPIPVPRPNRHIKKPKKKKKTWFRRVNC